MTARTSVTEVPDLAAVRTRVDQILDDFLTHKARSAAAQKMPREVIQTLHEFLFAGGKRLRPLLCVTGWHAADGHGDITPVLKAAASLEMFHAFALIHDDIIDRSDTRRGKPTVHRTLTARHSYGRGAAAAGHVGTSAAILIGDLALAWSDQILHTAGLTTRQLTSSLPLIDAMRTEVMYGQYLDLTATGKPAEDLRLALAIIRYKTAKYTIERPLHLGACLAGAPQCVLDACTAYAIPLGEAFQLRDDLLGVYGDPGRTGKPTLDDLREGKATVLIALGLHRASPAQRACLAGLIGNPHLTEVDAAEARHILTVTGAGSAVEQMIIDRHHEALTALGRAPLPPAVVQTLHDLAATAVHRTS